MRRKLRLEDLIALARSKGGQCLATQYAGSQVKLEWQCNRGHKWWATANNVRRGTWCRVCAQTPLRTIDDVRQWAREKGGRCLSDKYVSAHEKLLWVCADGHQWSAPPNSIRRGSWCKVCAGYEKRTIADMQEAASSRGGLCLSSEYKNATTPLLWQCSEGHRWWATPNSVRSRNTWCATCLGRNKTAQDMQAVAASRMGRFCSDEYRGDSVKHTWQCAEGHQWEATPNGVANAGTWCPVCAKGLSERSVRFILEKLFQRAFPTLKPKWLINQRGGRMELDGYCESLGLAFEYQGIQHFQFSRRFHGSESALAQRIQDDKVKRELCERHGVKLIVITCWTPHSGLEKAIIDECDRLEIAVKTTKDRAVPRVAYLRKNIERMQRLAKQRGGVCLSEAYVNAHTKLKWQCANGHQWAAKPNGIQQGQWCPECQRARRKRNAKGQWI